MRTAPLALLIALVAQQTSVAQVTWVQNPANGHYYALSNHLSWTQAEQQAQVCGGHLATVRNAAENQWLAATFASGTECLWIGLNDSANEGTFEWSSGEPVTFTNWWTAEPSDDLGNADWVHFSLPWVGPQANAFWNDSPDGATTYGWISRGIMEVATLPPLASYTPTGTGCVGPNGLTPLLMGVPGEGPRPSTTSHLRVTNLPPTVTIPLFVVGFSDAWDPDGYPLPIDLGILGWPGCQQLVSDEILYWEITTSGQADQPITIPAGYPLGFTFHVQVLVLYAPEGVALSNAVTGVVGY